MESLNSFETENIQQIEHTAFFSRFFWYLIKRLGILFIVLIAVSMLTFSVTRIAGTPLYAAIGVYSTKEMIEERKVNLLDDLNKVRTQGSELERQKLENVALQNALTGAIQQCDDFLNKLGTESSDEG